MGDTMPDCYGRMWEADAPECAGGYDAGFVGKNGQHVRPKCDYFDACRVRTHVARTNSAQPAMVPPSALVRNQPAQPTAAQPQWSPYGWQLPPQQPTRQPQGAAAQQMTQAQQQQAQLQAQQMPWQMMAAGMPPPWMMGGMPMMGPGGPMMNPFLPPPMYPGQFPVHGNIDPIKMQAVNYGMPAYLSASEQYDGFWPTLGREVFRGMGKALGHSIAHFFDHHPLGRR